MQSLLGTESQCLHFDPKPLYPNDTTIHSLQTPFTDEDIELAVKQLAKNKASGPDGVPNEFLQWHWADIKSDILAIIHGFLQHRTDLTPINLANIVMIPKVDAPESVHDYRPISIINGVPKIISKMLSNRLKEVMPELVSPQQTAFIKGRQISENFIATREMLQSISSSKRSVFAKLDFAKAFDSVNWNFLIKVLKVRGFPNNWLIWITKLLETASSRVLINGEPSGSFFHRKGLRQGDPLSPFLFNLAVDVLQKMIQAANSLLSSTISPRIVDSIIAHQYADDTAIIAASDIATVITLKMVLRMFSAVSGLQINYHKSLLVPINVQPIHLTEIIAVMGCKESSFPVVYLGMPLTLTKPTRDQYMPIIEKLQRRLDGWQMKLLSRGGRLQLVHSVLSAIPIYYMTCFALPEWAHTRMDQIRRNFLWGRNGVERSGVPLLNWNAVTLPKKWGGMGVANLRLRNTSLLLRWWWKAYKEPASLWSATIFKLRFVGTNTDGPSIWSVQGSFFWRQLRKIKPLFHQCTTWQIGQGTTISFWYDTWGDTPVLSSEIGPRPPFQKISLRDAMDIIQHIAPQLPIMLQPNFNSDNDCIIWKFENSGVYSAKSIYAVLSGIGKVRDQYAAVWHLKCTPTAKIFFYLLLKDRLLTHEVMARRNFNCDISCVLCSTGSVESALHMFFQCSYAVRVWRHAERLSGTKLLIRGVSAQDTWNRSKCRHRESGTFGVKEKAVAFVAVCWAVWKQRNTRIFQRKRSLPEITAEWAIQEARLWCRLA